MFEYFANGGNMSGITFKNGWAMWGTLEGNPFLEGYDGDMYVSNTGSVVLHRAKVEDSSFNWYGPAGKGNWFFGTAGVLSGFAGAVQSQNMYSQGLRRGLSGNYVLKGRNLSQFGGIPATKASTPISRIGRIGKIAGHFSFGIGVISDIGGVATGKVSIGKALLNTGFGAAGNWGGSIGASISTVYFFVDNFYPGGWPQYYDSANKTQAELDEGFNQAGPYRINLFGAHEPK
jgi:hypothetical protein